MSAYKPQGSGDQYSTKPVTHTSLYWGFVNWIPRSRSPAPPTPSPGLGFQGREAEDLDLGLMSLTRSLFTVTTATHLAAATHCAGGGPCVSPPRVLGPNPSAHRTAPCRPRLARQAPLHRYCTATAPTLVPFGHHHRHHRHCVQGWGRSSARRSPGLPQSLSLAAPRSLYDRMTG